MARAVGNETDVAPTSPVPTFMGQDLRGTNLRGALLIGADLRRADLRDADLAGADLRGANLAGADLRGTLFVTQSQLEAANGDQATLLSPQLVRPAHWQVLEPLLRSHPEPGS